MSKRNRLMSLDRIDGRVLKPIGPSDSTLSATRKIAGLVIDSSLPARTIRKSQEFADIPHTNENLFQRADQDGHVEELNEIFSYSEAIDFFSGRDLARKRGITNENISRHLPDLVECLSHTDRFQRLQAGDILVYFLVGSSNSSNPKERSDHSSSIARELFDCGLLAPVLSGLPVGVEDMFSVDWDDSMAGSHPPAAYWEASKELRLHLNFLLLLLLLQHDSKEVVRTITRSKVGGKPLVSFCLSLLASSRLDMFPLKKLLLVVRWTLLFELGGIDAGVPSMEEQDSQARFPKCSRADLKDICNHCTRCFSPMGFVDHQSDVKQTQLIYFDSTPASLRERAEIAKRSVHSSYSDIADLIDLELPQESLSPPARGSAEAFYRDLVADLPRTIVGILKVLLSMAPNVRQNVHMLHLSREFVISAGLDAIGDGIERSRHYEILLKSISFILLRLLKSFRHNQPLQFSYLQTLLQDKNALVIILKFLNQNIAISCTKVNEIPALNAFSSDLWSLEGRDEVLDGILHSSCMRFRPNCVWAQHLIVSLTASKGLSWRKYFVYSNLLRLLQKISKGSSKQLQSLVKFRAPLILKRILFIPQQDFIYYSLKLLKAQMPYLDRKWRNEHTQLITEVFLRIRMRLFDSWLSPPTTDEEEASYLHRAIRRRCCAFNLRYHKSETPSVYDLPNTASEEEIIRVCCSEEGAQLSRDFTSNVEGWLEKEGFR